MDGRTNGRTDGRTDERTEDSITRCLRRTFQAGDITTQLYLTFILPWIREKKNDIWLSPMTKSLKYKQKYQQPIDNTKTPPETSITQQLRIDLRRSVWVTTTIRLVWLNRFYLPFGDHSTLARLLANHKTMTYTKTGLWMQLLNKECAIEKDRYTICIIKTNKSKIWIVAWYLQTYFVIWT